MSGQPRRAQLTRSPSCWAFESTFSLAISIATSGGRMTGPDRHPAPSCAHPRRADTNRRGGALTPKWRPRRTLKGLGLVVFEAVDDAVRRVGGVVAGSKLERQTCVGIL